MATSCVIVSEKSFFMLYCTLSRNTWPHFGDVETGFLFNCGFLWFANFWICWIFPISYTNIKLLSTKEKYLLILEIIFSQDVATQIKTWGIILIAIHLRKLICFHFLISTFPMEKKYQLHIQEKMSKIGFVSHFFGRSGKFGLRFSYWAPRFVPRVLGFCPCTPTFWVKTA